MVNTLNFFRNGGVGFIDWLDRRRPFLNRASVTHRESELGQTVNRPETMFSMLVADRGSKLAEQHAAVGDDKNVVSGNDLEQVRIYWRARRNINR